MSEERRPLTILGSQILARQDLLAQQEYQVKGYDFKRPDKFSRDQIRTVAMIHETFARLGTTSLTGLLRLPVSLSLASVDQLTFAEFGKSIPEPTLMGVVRLEPLRGAALFQWDPQLCAAILDRLFGGRGAAGAGTRKPTELEKTVFNGLFERLLPGLRESWGPVIDLHPKISNLETHFTFAQIVPPSDMVINIGFEMKVGEIRGFCNFCVPYIAIESIIGRLTAQYFYTPLRTKGENRLKGTQLENLQHAPLPLTLSKRTRAIPLARLAGLERGDLLPLHGDGLAYLEAQGATLLTLRPGQKKGNPWQVVGNPEADRFDDLFQTKKEHGGAGAGTSGLTSLVEEPLAALRVELTELAKGMQTGMDALRKSQEESNEQFHFWMMQKEEGVETRENQREKPFGFLEGLTRGGAEESIATFLAPELPQLVALVLSQLEGPSAAAILGKLPPDMHTPVVERLAVLDRVTPEVAGEVARLLQQKLSMVSQEGPRPGGIREVVELLNHSPREVEKRVVEALEKKDPSLAEAIKQRMFTFWDLLLLDAPSIAGVLNRISREDLLKALKTVDATFRQSLFAFLPEKDRVACEAAFAGLTRLRLSEVEEAQQRIVNTVRLMEDQGEIHIARKDETIV